VRMFEFDYDYELLNVSARALGARAVNVLS
jgi:hypothetical protein